MEIYIHIHEYAASTTVDVLVGLMFYLQNKYISDIQFSGHDMARWLSRLERRPVTAEVVGSIPSRVVCGSAEIGRQARLRILCPIGRVGSSPISRITRKAEKSAFRFFYTLNG